MKNEIKNLAHSSYRCQYHIVFVPDVFCKLSAEGHLHLVCWNPIQEFLFNGCKEVFHSGAIKTVIYTAETLQNTRVTELLAKCFAYVLVSSITMHNCSV